MNSSDLIVAEWYDDEEKETFVTGLANVDSRARGLYGKNFVNCATESRQGSILQAMDDEVCLPRGRGARSQTTRRRRNHPPEKNFLFHDQTAHAGWLLHIPDRVEQELHAEIIPSRHAGCVPLEEEAAK